jgi:hypothetical protein
MTIEEYYDKRSSSYDSTFDMLYFKLFDLIIWKFIEPYVPVDLTLWFWMLVGELVAGQSGWREKAVKWF